jgi:hypothetical protein
MRSRVVWWCVVCLGSATLARADLISLYDFEGPNPFDDKISGVKAAVGAKVSLVSNTPLGNAASIPAGTNPATNDSDIVVAQADAPAIGSSDFTCTAWVQRASGAAGTGGICDMVNGTGEGGFQLLFGPTNDFRFGTGGPQDVWMLYQSTRLITDTEWHHFAVSVDRDQPAGLALYIDGVVDKTGDPTGFASVSMAANQDYHIGTMNQTLLNGLLDELAIFNTALSAGEIQKVMQGIRVCPECAGDPHPDDAAVEVPRDVLLNWSPGESATQHDVYLGTVFTDVNEADRTHPRNVLVSQGQDANSFDLPTRLEFGRTYYWRVDEIQGPANAPVSKGDVWSFTVEPFSYPIGGDHITATASSASTAAMGPEKTIDGSGLNAADQHSIGSEQMWLSASNDPAPWILYTFDNVYKLDRMLVWNSNQAIETTIGFGAKAVKVEYSLDGTAWTALGDFQFAQGSGSPTYTANTTIDFAGAAARSVRLSIGSNWGGIVKQYGLSEVRFFSVPVLAREPNPASGATGADVDAPLSWRAGREAARHQVYVSTDPQAVTDETSPTAAVSQPRYAAEVDLDTTYYWKVVEVNEAETPSMWAGEVWSFTTEPYLVVDDFESYADDQEAGQAIFQTWVDGYDSPSNGSVVGNDPAPFAERTIINSGRQSMPLAYDNTGTATYSEATRTFDTPQDWGKHAIKGLTLRFYGDPANVAQQMYAKINNTKVPYDGAPADLLRKQWQMWYVDVTVLDVSQVTKLTIGFDRLSGTGGQGKVFIDDLRLYPLARSPIVPVDPGTAGLQAQYQFEGNFSDNSGHQHTGAPAGIVSFVPGQTGQAITLGGREDYVEVADYSGVTGTQSRTCSAWIQTTKASEEILSWGQNVAGQKWVFRLDTNGQIRAEVNGGYIVGTTDLRDDTWHHVAAVFETDETPDVTDIRLYVDGVQETVSTQLSKAIDTATDGVVRIGKSPWSGTGFFFEGLIDDVRIYDYALSAAEVASLAGRTLPFDKPF